MQRSNSNVVSGSNSNPASQESGSLSQSEPYSSQEPLDYESAPGTPAPISLAESDDDKIPTQNLSFSEQRGERSPKRLVVSRELRRTTTSETVVYIAKRVYSDGTESDVPNVNPEAIDSVFDNPTNPTFFQSSPRQLEEQGVAKPSEKASPPQIPKK